MSIKFFSDLQLSPEVQKSLRKLKVTELTPIQTETIPLLMKGIDVIGQAQTGTGKTAAFGLPLIMKIDIEEDKIQGLVIIPTRELGLQVSNMMKKFARYTGVKIVSVYGGESITKQVTRLEGRTHIIIGTPGRLIDLIKRRVLDLSYVKVVVLDEADKLLEMGFINDVRFILTKLPYVRQTSMWSATLSEELISYARRFMRRPRKVLVSKNEVSQPLVEQYFLYVEPEQKIHELIKLFKNLTINQAIIFCNTRLTTEKIAEYLIDSSFSVSSLHGKYKQSKREEIMDAFRRKHIKFLVATDLAARGLDIPSVSHVFNFDVPEDPEIYFHRIGRTGRIGFSGISVTLMTRKDDQYFEKIKSMTQLEIREFKTELN